MSNERVSRKKRMEIFIHKKKNKPECIWVNNNTFLTDSNVSITLFLFTEEILISRIICIIYEGSKLA